MKSRDFDFLMLVKEGYEVHAKVKFWLGLQFGLLAGMIANLFCGGRVYFALLGMFCWAIFMSCIRLSKYSKIIKQMEDMISNG